MYAYIHSGHFYSASSSPLLLRGAPDYSMDSFGYCIEVSCQSTQETVSKGLAQCPYVAARTRVKPATLRLRVIYLTIAPPRPNDLH